MQVRTGEQVSPSTLLRTGSGTGEDLQKAAERDVENASTASKLSPNMVGTWFFDNPHGDEEQMAIFPDGKVVVLYSNGHKDEVYYKEGFIELPEYDNTRFKLSIDKEGTLLQIGREADKGQSIQIEVTKRWKRIHNEPQIKLLRPLTGTDTTKPGMKAEGEGKVGEKERMQNLVEDFFKHNYRDITARKTIEWVERRVAASCV